MAARFSRLSAVGLILALTLAFEGCAAPLHLAWKRGSEFDSKPSRIVGTSTTLSIRCTAVSDTRALLAAEIVTATHYEREVSSRHDRHLGFGGFPWTIALLSWLLGEGASVGQADHVASTAADPGAEGMADGGITLVAVITAFIVTCSGIGICVDIVWLLLSIPPVIREGLSDDENEDRTRVLTYALSRARSCNSLTLSDSATGASIELGWIPASGASLDAATLRTAGFRSAELEACSGDLRARVVLPEDFARSLEGR